MSVARKKKILETIFNDFHEEVPACPKCSGADSVVKSGTRDIREDTVQIYLCNDCQRKFSKRKLANISYPPRLILRALTYYNQGHSLNETTKFMNRRYKVKIPRSTLTSWRERHGPGLPFNRLRDRYELDPNKNIRTRKLFHPQPLLFKVHGLKLNLKGLEFPQLKQYIYSMLDERHDHIFQDKKALRCSYVARDLEPPEVSKRTVKDSPACKMTNLALELARTKGERHQKIEEFFLINDTATVAVEMPVYITRSRLRDLGLKPTGPLIGHIDILQVRNKRVHIMDYKPEAKKEKNVVTQLWLYAELLSARTKIDLSRMVVLGSMRRISMSSSRRRMIIGREESRTGLDTHLASLDVCTSSSSRRRMTIGREE